MSLQLHVTQRRVPDHVATDITGATGLRVIRAIVAGERDPAVLAALRDCRCKASEETLRQALAGKTARSTSSRWRRPWNSATPARPRWPRVTCALRQR